MLAAAATHTERVRLGTCVLLLALHDPLGVAEEALHWGVEFYRRRGVQMPLPPVGELRRTPNTGIYGVPFAVGTPEDVLRGLSVYRDEPLDQLALQFHAPGMNIEHVKRSMRGFAREIMPEIRSRGPKRTAG